MLNLNRHQFHPVFVSRLDQQFSLLETTAIHVLWIRQHLCGIHQDPVGAAFEAVQALQ